jgi:hypothetical protein
MSSLFYFPGRKKGNLDPPACLPLMVDLRPLSQIDLPGKERGNRDTPACLPLMVDLRTLSQIDLPGK